jgi:hypothetical protein
MRLKRSNAGVRVYVLVSFVVLLLTAVVPTSALALNPERHYEMVSPVFKGGFGVGSLNAASIFVAPDGESAAYFSPGAFSGAPSSWQGLFDYVARRGAAGWSTVPLMVPAPLLPGFQTSDLSQLLDQVLVVGQPGDTHYILRNDEADLVLRSTSLSDVSANWELAGVLQSVVHTNANLQPAIFGGTRDLCHVLLSTGAVSDVLVPAALGAERPLYEFDRGCNGEPSALRLATVNNAGMPLAPKCPAGAGSGTYAQKVSAFNAMSEDGAEVFFTGCLSGSGAAVPGSLHQLFVRVGGARTLEVSRPLSPCVAQGVSGEVPCDGASERPSADFVGASEDGSTVYFTTAAPLVEGDKDSGNDVYMAKIGCPEAKPGCGAGERQVRALVQVSHDPNGGAAEVQGVVRVAPDGRRVYYVASGDLLSSAQGAALEGEGRPVPRAGAENLYVYDAATANTAFIAELCSGAGLSGTVEDSQCPNGQSDSSLWLNEGPEAQTAGSDARFLVFSTVGELTGDDANAHRDVYRYDAETGVLRRVSLGEDGYAANGNASPLGSSILPAHFGGSVVDQYEMESRAVSEDGSRIVFTSAAALSPAAGNGLANAYEWHMSPGEREGRVSIVSTGQADAPVVDVVISPNGRSVFFLTTQGLVPQDTDGAADVYDARLGSGFATEPAESRPCQGDACQGPLMNPAPLLVPGSVSQAPGENLTAPAPPQTAPKPNAKAGRCKKSFVRRKGKCVKAHKAKARKAGHGRRGSR